MTRTPGAGALRWGVHPLLLVVLAAAAAGGQLEDLLPALLAVTLHELAHVVVARGFGLPVSRVELGPAGAHAEVPGLAGEAGPVQGLVALAGPLENLLLAAALETGGRALGWAPARLETFIHLNLALGLVNLLPVAPLDGGTLLRAYWGGRIGYRAAARRTRRAGQALALGLAGLGLLAAALGRILPQVWVFAAFLYWAAGVQEAGPAYWVARDLALRPLAFRRRPVWPLEDLAVAADAPLRAVLAAMRQGRVHRVTVLDENLQVLGSLMEAALWEGLTRYGPEVPVARLLAPPPLR
ncbi:Peptidase M50 [Candidatus Hydrogenisulfobacillus filiaventi]|uniref:Peptidase M50 n=1 Tax=Candidatus Hydrogenisulfobacillus filiaventi TaxID=2707344 RepID=A0A6F8ZJN9_9FIRM|nr:site-2 protease family protein [Bacillota bacterium]CAB1129673.1 Peptidase M50 [Candidatus Hydrogenisulfobacillus filiaventi]